MQKPWEGRFKERTEEFVERFTQSVSFDKELAPWDIRQSIAHVKTLLKAGLLKEEEAQRLIEGLEAIKKEILEGSFEFKEELEEWWCRYLGQCANASSECDRTRGKGSCQVGA